MRLARLGGLVSAIALAATMTACGSSQKTVDVQPSAGAEGGNAGALIGVTMPTKSSERWIHDGDNVKAQLEKLGYKVDLQYAENDIPTQANQIENQITKGAKLLIIASIDGTAITSQLQQAADNKIPVIAYDRLIRNSPNVDYYATFDNFKVGVQQASSLLAGLGVDKGEKGPFNVELFGGSPDDNNATFFWNGAMSILQPKIDDGTTFTPLSYVSVSLTSGSSPLRSEMAMPAATLASSRVSLKIVAYCSPERLSLIHISEPTRRTPI